MINLNFHTNLMNENLKQQEYTYNDKYLNL
jgi:hypothetical protein